MKIKATKNDALKCQSLNNQHFKLPAKMASAFGGKSYCFLKIFWFYLNNFLFVCSAEGNVGPKPFCYILTLSGWLWFMDSFNLFFCSIFITFTLWRDQSWCPVSDWSITFAYINKIKKMFKILKLLNVSSVSPFQN